MNKLLKIGSYVEQVSDAIEITGFGKSCVSVLLHKQVVGCVATRREH